MAAQDAETVRPAAETEARAEAKGGVEEAEGGKGRQARANGADGSKIDLSIIKYMPVYTEIGGSSNNNSSTSTPAPRPGPIRAAVDVLV